jgi:hypothetical protein
MNTAPRAIGNYVSFFRDKAAFTVPSAGTVSRTAKPDGADPAWIDFGVVNNLGATPSSNKDEIYGPTSELEDVIESKRKVEVKFDAEELQFLSFELAFQTKPLSAAGGNYNSGNGKTVKGWIKIEQYDMNEDEDAPPINVVDLYCHIQLDGDLKCDDNHVKTGIVATRLRSALNQGTLIAS